MATKQQIEQTRDSLIEQQQKIRDKKNEAAQEKYTEFIAKVEEDTTKRLNIVNKVIDAEAEERLFKEEQIRKQKESAEREAAEQKMREEFARQEALEEEKKKKAAAKKAAKARKKMLALRAKVPIPPGYVPIKDSKKLYAKLKKLNSAGRYAFCCFYVGKKDKKFSAYCEELSGEYNTNVAWFDCCIKDSNFEEAMLLYEFNATPAVVVCFEGKPSNLHRYVIGFTDDTKETLKRYA